VLKKGLEFIVYTNVWVALAVAALSAFTFIIIGRLDYNFICFSFFATLLMYAYARWFEAPAREDESTSRITDWKNSHKFWQIFSGIIGAAGAIYFATFLEKNTLFILLICGGISAMYPLQFLKRGQVALRNVAGIKLFIISLIWAIVSTVLPAVQLGYGFSTELVFLTLQRFLFVMAITIPFDIRDLRIDSPDINTLPYKIGLRPARNVALVALLLAEVGAFVMYFSDTITAPVLLGQVLAFEITSLFIKKSSPKKPDLYFSFGVEGTSILLFLSVAIFTYFWP